jgi:hypothetical protein
MRLSPRLHGFVQPFPNQPAKLGGVTDQLYGIISTFELSNAGTTPPSQLQSAMLDPARRRPDAPNRPPLRRDAHQLGRPRDVPAAADADFPARLQDVGMMEKLRADPGDFFSLRPGCGFSQPWLASDISGLRFMSCGIRSLRRGCWRWNLKFPAASPLPQYSRHEPYV